MQENNETQTNSEEEKSLDNDRSKSGSAGEVREGQPDSSIRHDKKDPDKELSGTIHKDISATSQEEFINDDENTRKHDDS